MKIAEINHVLKNQMQVFIVKNKEILLVNVDGEFYALDNKCPHMGYPLFFGKLEGSTIICGFHNAKFNIKTGQPLASVTDKPLKTFPVKIKKAAIYIEIESSEQH
ncbi:MAG: Rieske 2Fe-2S domain-containing protein [Candidatus Bathyarchaeota archaeon]|nr:Rieske 2Fe-2S domain-containing protein [Candidatus Bathyarchaeota archaeon]